MSFDVRGVLFRIDTAGASGAILQRAERFSCQAEIKVNGWFRLRMTCGAGIAFPSLHEGLPSAHRLERRTSGAMAVQFLLDGLFSFAYAFAGRPLRASSRFRSDLRRSRRSDRK
jgi:hypothetical protein